MYRTIIIEDEEKSCNRIKRLLEKMKNMVEIIGEATDGPGAVAVVNQLKPDLIFCDIELPGISAIEVLGQLTCRPVVIFTTAYDKHALQDSNTGAVDFLVKPVDEDALMRAFKKLEIVFGKKTGNPKSPFS